MAEPLRRGARECCQALQLQLWRQRIILILLLRGRHGGGGELKERPAVRQKGDELPSVWWQDPPRPPPLRRRRRRRRLHVGPPEAVSTGPDGEDHQLGLVLVPGLLQRPPAPAAAAEGRRGGPAEAALAAGSCGGATGRRRRPGGVGRPPGSEAERREHG